MLHDKFVKSNVFASGITQASQRVAAAARSHRSTDHDHRAQAHVGLCAVVMVRRSVRSSRCGDSLTCLRDTTGKHIRFHKLIMQHLFCTCLLLLLYNFCDAQIISHTTFFGRILVHIRIHAPFVPHAPS